MPMAREDDQDEPRDIIVNINHFNGRGTDSQQLSLAD